MMIMLTEIVYTAETVVVFDFFEVECNIFNDRSEDIQPSLNHQRLRVYGAGTLMRDELT